jgi:hypothetical protein
MFESVDRDMSEERVGRMAVVMKVSAGAWYVKGSERSDQRKGCR